MRSICLATAFACAITFTAGCGGGDDADLSAIHGVWDWYSPLVSGDRCGWPRMAVDDQSVRFLFGKGLTLACYRVQRVVRDGARYTFELQELSTMATAGKLDELERLGTEATARCTEGLASGRAGTAKRMVVEMAGTALRIQSSPDPVVPWEGIELSSSPLACQPAGNSGRRAV